MHVQRQSGLNEANRIIYWVLCGALSGALAYPLFLFASAGAFNQAFDRLLPAFLVGALLSGLVSGAMMGICQWLVLRQDFPGTNGWVLVSMVGWAVGMVVSVGLFLWVLPEGLNILSFVIPLAFGGAAAGYVQSLILRRWVHVTGWWVLATASGWILGPILAFTLLGRLEGAHLYPPGLVLAILGAIHGGVIGFQTGLAYSVLKSNFPVLDLDGGQDESLGLGSQSSS